MSRTAPANVPSCPPHRALQAALLVAAICFAPRAHALNKLGSPGFEPSMTPAAWIAQAMTGDAQELAFGPAGTPTIQPYEGSLAYRGNWTATVNGQSAARTLTQSLAFTAPVRAKLRGFYRRTGSGSGKATTLSCSLKDSAGADVVLAPPLTATSTGIVNDPTWMAWGWTAPVLLAAGSYSVEILWSVLLQDNGQQAMAVDLVELQASPSGLAATVSPGSVALAWQPSTGSPGLRATTPYMINRRTATTARALLAWSQATGYTDNSVAPNTEYFYDLTDFDTGDAESPASVELAVRSLPASPGAPTFSAVAETTMTVGWTAPTGGAESYKLERAPDAAGAPGAWSEIASALNATSFPDSGLSCATTYWYRVRATNASGDGPWSTESSQATTSCPAIIVGDYFNANPAAATKCPHDPAAQTVDAFSLQTNKGTDTVTSVTVTLAAGTAAALDRVEVAAWGGAVLGTVNLPNSDVVVVPVAGMTAVAGAPTNYRIRVVPRDHALMPVGSFAVTAHVSAIESGYGLKTYLDASGGPVTFDNQPPDAPSWSSETATDARVTLIWNAAIDANLYIVLRGTSAVTASPAENTTYAINGDLDGFTVRHWSANTNLDDLSVANGTGYHYKLAARDSCGNWSAGVAAGPLVPQGTTTVGDGNAPTNANLCPGGAATFVDGFSLKASTGTDAVTAVTVSFPAGTAAGLSLVEITSDNGGTVYGSAIDPTDVTTVSMAPGFAATTTTVNYKVRVTPKAEAALPLPGASYSITAQVTAVESFNEKLYQDGDSATVGLDNEAPTTSALSATADDSHVDLAWTASGTGVLVLRDTLPIEEGPGEGSTYALNAMIGTAKVVYAGALPSFADLTAVNGTTYHYALYAHDGCKNYSAAAKSGPHTPRGVTTVGNGTAPTNASLCPGGAATFVDGFSLATSADTDTVTAVTVSFPAGTAAGLSLVEITGDTGSPVYGSTTVLADVMTLSLATPIGATTATLNYRVRVTPKAEAALPLPGASYSITAQVTGIACSNEALYQDTVSATVGLDNEAPAAPALQAPTVLDSQINLAWTASGTGVLVLRDTAPITQGPSEGATYALNAMIGTAKVVYVGTNSSLADATAINGTTYHYAVYAHDGCRNYSAAATSGALTSKGTTTVGNGGAPSNATLCSGGAAIFVDGFSLETSTDTDTVNSVTVSFPAGTTAGLSLVEITSDNGLTVYGSATALADVTIVNLAAPITATTSLLNYRVRITPKAEAELPSASYSITALVTDIDCSNEKSLADSASATVVFDNQAPAAPTLQAPTILDSQIDLVWTASGTGVLLLRDTAPITQGPSEGATYATGAMIGTASVVYAGANAAFDDASAVNGTSYHYALYAHDGCRNYSAAATSGPHTPKGLTTVGNGTAPGNASLCPGGAATFVDGFSLKSSADTDTVTAVTVSFPAGTAAGLALVEITSDGGGTVYGSATALADVTIVNLAAPITATTGAVNYRVRITPKAEAQLPLPGVSYSITAKVTDIDCSNEKFLDDSASATVGLDNESPTTSALTATAGDSRVDLAWTSTGTGVLLLRDTTAITQAPDEGATYANGAMVGSAKIVYAGTASAFADTTAVNGTAYQYALYAHDGCRNYSAAAKNGPLTPKGVTTVGNGGAPANAALCPGDAAKPVDGFSLQGSAETVTAITVDFPAGTAEALSLVEITNEAGTTAYGSGSAPTDATTVSLTTPIAVTSTNTRYMVRVTPKAAAAMPAGPGLRYQITGLVSAITSPNEKTYSDTASATLTIDNESPAAPAWASMVDDDGRVDLSWTFAGTGVVVLRGTAAIAQPPAEGTSYMTGNTVGAATVVYVGNGTSLSDTDVSNGTTYHYAVYAHDGCLNYSAGAPSGPRVPSAGTTTIGDGEQLPDVELCPGGEPVVVDAFTLQTSRGADSITELTVRLAAGTAAAVAKVELLNDALSVIHGQADDPASEEVQLVLDTALTVGTSPTQYRIRLTPKAHDAMPAPLGALHGLSATLEDLASANLVAGSDANSAVASLDNLSSEPPAWGEVVAAEATLQLSWTAPADAEQVLLLRALAPITAVPVEGTSYMPGTTLGSASAIYVGAGSSFPDAGLGDGMEYYYAAFARDACGNWSLAAQLGPIVPGEPTTILSEGADPADSNTCPGGQAQAVDTFELKTAWGIDQVTELTLSLSAGTAEAVALVEVTSADGQTLYGSAADPGADVLSITLDTPLPVDSVATAFGLRLTPKSHAQLSALPGKLYEVGCRVVYFTCSNTSVGSEANSATLTVDHAAPAAPEFGPAVDDNGQVTLSWSAPADPDLDGFLLARGPGALPQAGQSYQANSDLGESLVVFAGEASSHAEPRPADDETVYRLFARDTCGNWSLPTEQQPLSPSTDGGGPAVAMGAYDLGGCGCTQGAAPLAAMAALFSLVILRRRRD